MPLIRMGEMLKAARQQKIGVPAINVINMETILYTIEAAEAARRPVIISFYPKFIPHFPMSACAAIACDAAAAASVPVAVHLDHSDSFDLVLGAMGCGYGSVLFDVSPLPYDENCARTKEVVRAARALGCNVEGELGYVGWGDRVEDYDDREAYTDPAEAARYVQETGVDALAVAVGNAHGAYAKTPKLDLERVAQLAACVPVPLVMHGGSGIPDDQIRECVRLGVVKYNYGTDFMKTYLEGMRAAMPQATHYYDLEKTAKAAALEYLHGRFAALRA